MKVHRSTIAMAAVFSALLIVTTFSFFVVPYSSEGRTFRSSLIQPHDAENVSTIAISDTNGGGSVTISKKDESWLVSSSNARTVPADTAKIQSFLSTIAESRLLYTTHATSDRPLFEVTLEKADATIISSISFFDTDTTGTRIAFRTARDITVLQTDDAFSQFLKPSTASWIRHDAFADIEKNADAQRILYRQGSRTAVLGKGDKGLIDFMSALESLECLDSESIPAKAPETVSIEMGDASVLTLAFAPLGENYCVVDEGRQYAWRISARSYARLKDALGI